MEENLEEETVTSWGDGEKDYSFETYDFLQKVWMGAAFFGLSALYVGKAVISSVSNLGGAVYGVTIGKIDDGFRRMIG